MCSWLYLLVLRPGLAQNSDSTINANIAFSNDDEFIITADGKLVDIEEAAIVDVDGGFQFQYSGSVTQFFSTGSADSPIEITSSITQTTTSTNEKQTTMSQSATDEHGVTITPEVSANGKVNEVAVGVKTSVQVSNKVINKIDKVIATKLNVQVSTTMLYTEKQNITLKAGKLTAIKTSWQRRFATGTVVLGRDSFTYEAALGYMTSREIKEYASVEDMPPDLLAEYRRLHPAYRPPFRLIEGVYYVKNRAHQSM